MFKKSLLAMTAAGLMFGGLAARAPVNAEITAKAGFLTCQVDSGWGFVFGSSRKLHCTYSGSGRVERYEGNISKFGVDIGYLQGGLLVWGVVAPTATLAPGALEGDYGGVTAGATVGIGGGANVLVGGSTRTISLQPLSLEGNQGLNVAAGIAAVSLKHQPS